MALAGSAPAVHSKLNVIRHHIRSAIQMIAIECHPFSVHTVVMACERLILEIARKRDVSVEWDYKIWIKDEKRREFEKTIKNKAYNYFHHADEDHDRLYDGPEVENLDSINELQTFLNIHGYVKLAGISEPDFDLYAALVLARHPHLFRPEFLERHSELQKQLSSLDGSRSTMLHVLRLMLLSANLLPNALLL